jgi:hypothetical protein
LIETADNLQLADPLEDVGEAVDGLTAGLGVNLNLESTLENTGGTADQLTSLLGLDTVLGRKKREGSDGLVDSRRKGKRGRRSTDSLSK